MMKHARGEGRGCVKVYRCEKPFSSDEDHLGRARKYEDDGPGAKFEALL